MATEVGLNQKDRSLLWIVKKGMRLIREKNQECHERFEDLRDSYYNLYFDEKKNRLAYPPGIAKKS